VSRAGRHAAPARRSPAAPATARPPRWLELACLLSPLAAIAALAWSLRGAPLGTPVADDFEFLHRIVFRGDTGLFGSMGATYYWRPLSRQAWFQLVAPLLLAAPGVVAALHGALLAAIAFVLARLARRLVPWPAAALVAAAAIATEPARVLVTWPSGIQHLLAPLALALTVHESFAGRRWSAALAALAAALSHELGAFAFVLFGAGGFLRCAGRAAWIDAGLATALAALWAAGYRQALASGVLLPAAGIAPAPGAWLEALGLALGAAFNTETLAAPWAGPVRVLTSVLFAGSLAWVLLTKRREPLGAVARMLGVPLAIAWLGLVPLAALLPDWNAWRAFVPSLALAFAITFACARAHLALGLAVVALRLLALAGAEPARPVRGDPPATVSDLSLVRVARMQEVVAASGAIVRAAKLPPRARVAFLALPEMTMNGFRRDAAVQVWTRDMSARFVPFDDHEAGPERADLVLSYDFREGRDLVLVLTPEARRWWRQAEEAANAGRLAESREDYLRALAAQRPESPSLTANALQNLALQEIDAGHLEAADSLNRAAWAARGTTPEVYAIAALLAARHGDLPRARDMVARGLRLGPRNTLAQAVLAEVQRLEAARNSTP